MVEVRFDHMSHRVLTRRQFAWGGVATLALLASGVAGCSCSAAKEFTLLCPESLSDGMRQLADSYNAAGKGASVTVEDVPGDTYNADYIAQRLGSDKAAVAVLDAGVSAVDISGVDLYEMTSYFDASDPNRTLSLPSGESCYELPLCGTVGLLLCNSSVFEKEHCGTPSSIPALAQDMSYFDSLGYHPLEVEEFSGQSASVQVLVDSLETCGVADYLEFSSEEAQESAARAAQIVLEALKDSQAEQVALSRGQITKRFKSGSSAMMLATSDEYLEIVGSGTDCAACSVPGITDDPYYSLTPAVSIVASSGAGGAGLESFCAWLVGDGQQAIYDLWHKVPVSRDVNVDESFSQLYEAMCPDGSDVKLSIARLRSQEEFDELVRTALPSGDGEADQAEKGK